MRRPLSRWTPSVRLAMVALALFGSACAPPLPLALGDQCELNSDCDLTLVCLYDACRRECTSARDCAVGLDCLEGNRGFGVCQLPADLRCVRDSDCAGGLVCTDGECTNECDCAPGEVCRDCSRLASDARPSAICATYL